MMPTWQLAKVKSDVDMHEMRNKLLWIRWGPPVNQAVPLYSNPSAGYSGPIYMSNLIGKKGQRLMVRAEEINLLPTFAEHIPMREYEQWLDVESICECKCEECRRGYHCGIFDMHGTCQETPHRTFGSG